MNYKGATLYPHISCQFVIAVAAAVGATKVENGEWKQWLSPTSGVDNSHMQTLVLFHR
jgi:hypothetical protein